MKAALNNLAITLHSIQGIDETASAAMMSLSGHSQSLESAAAAVGTAAESIEEGARKVIQGVIHRLNKQTRADKDIDAFLSPETRRDRKEMALEAIEDFAAHHEIVQKTYDNELAKHLIKQGKTDAKFLRQ